MRQRTSNGRAPAHGRRNEPEAIMSNEATPTETPRPSFLTASLGFIGSTTLVSALMVLLSGL